MDTRLIIVMGVMAAILTVFAHVARHVIVKVFHKDKTPPPFIQKETLVTYLVIWGILSFMSALMSGAISDAGGMGVMIIIAVFCLYFLPCIIAMKRKRKNQNAIFILNLFLGWTFLGWVVAMVWAVSEDK